MANTTTKTATPPALSLAPPADWGMETTAARARREEAPRGEARVHLQHVVAPLRVTDHLELTRLQHPAK